MQFNIQGLHFENIESIHEHLENAEIEFSFLRGRKISLSDDKGNTQLLTANKIFEKIGSTLKKTKDLNQADREPLSALYKTCESLKNKGYNKEPDSSWNRAGLLTRLFTFLKHFFSHLFRKELPEFKQLNFSQKDNLQEKNTDANSQEEEFHDLQHENNRAEPPKVDLLFKDDQLPDYQEVEVIVEANHLKADHLLDDQLLDDQEVEVIVENDGLPPIDPIGPVDTNVAKQNAIDLVTANPSALNGLNDDLKYDRDVIRAAITKDGMALEYVQDRYDTAKEFYSLAITNNPQAYQWIHPFYRHDPNLVVQVLAHPQCPPSLAREIISRNTLLLRDAHESLKQDKMVHYDFLKSDPAFAIQVIGVNPAAYPYFADSIKNDPEMMKRALKHPQCSKELTLTILSNNGLLLEEAKQEFQQERDVCLTAFKQNPQIFSKITIPLYLSVDNVKEALQNVNCPIEFAYRQVEREGILIQFCNPQLKRDKDLVKKAVTQNGLALQHLGYNPDGSPSWNGDDEIIALAIANNPQAYEFVSSLKKISFVGNFDLEKKTIQHPQCSQSTALNLVKEVGWLYKYANATLKHDHEVCLTAFRKQPEIWSEIPIPLTLTLQDIKKAFVSDFGSDEFVKDQLKKDGMLLKECKYSDRQDPTFIKIAVAQNGLALQYGNKSYCPADDKEIALIAIENNPKAYWHAKDKLREDQDIIQKTLDHPQCDPDTRLYLIDL